jgi:Flp pilus assembly protein TadD
MMQYYPIAYPRWYVEGFAEFVMTADIRPQQITYGTYNRVRAAWLGDRRAWLPYEQILFGLPDGAGAEDLARFYAQSWLLVHYLFSNDERRDAFRRYLTALRRNEDPRQAFAASFGMDARGLDRALRDYSEGFTYLRIARPAERPPIPIAITRLPRSADDLLLHQAAIRRGGQSPERQQEILAAVRRSARTHGDSFSKRLLAQAEILYGDPAAADPLLDALLAEAPNDAELLYFKGMRHLVAGRADAERRREHFREARTWFARAHRADSNHFPTLYRYAESYSTEPGFVSENTANILMLATELAPQVQEIRLNAAQILLVREQFEEAEALLAPIVSSAHRGEAAVAAAALLELARTRTRPDPERLRETLSGGEAE